MVAAGRKCWVGGNWKCNGSLASIGALSETLNQSDFNPNKVDVVVCPSPIHILLAKQKLDKKFKICSQNISRTGPGAFTGETAVDMLKDAGVEWTLIGHSERRQYYGETDESVADKLKTCQDGGINAAVCIGETLTERQENKTIEVLKRQVEAFLSKVSDWSKVVIAYEPVWAIGTGQVATADQAQEAHAAIRAFLREKVNADVASKTRIVYGGSVTDGSAATLIAQPDIDGFLVGGASLKPGFNVIIKAVENASQ